jgi:hypothetical protein
MQGVEMMGIAALACGFVAELVGVAAAAYWGYQADRTGSVGSHSPGERRSV